MASGFTMTWLMDDTVQPNAGLSLARMTVEPGAVTETHRHPNCTETIFALEGAVAVHVDNETIALPEGKTALIPAGASHHIHNAGAVPAQLIVAYSAGTRIYEKVP